MGLFTRAFIFGLTLNNENNLSFYQLNLMFNKTITLIIGNDIYNMNPKLFDDFKYHEYEAFFIDEFGSKRTMDYWSGDKFFSNYMEIFYFFGIDEEEESTKCKGLKIWFKEYSTLNEKEKNFWMEIAEDFGYPLQIKINTSFGEVKDFEYDELKDLQGKTQGVF